MTDPTIPELVARLRELHEKLQALQVGTPEFTAARQLFRDALQLSAPGILDALDHIGDANKMVRGIPERTQGMQRERSTVVAYLHDRARQWEDDSGIPAILQGLASDIHAGEHVEARNHGELDDQLAHSPDGGKVEEGPGFLSSDGVCPFCNCYADTPHTWRDCAHDLRETNQGLRERADRVTLDFTSANNGLRERLAQFRLKVCEALGCTKLVHGVTPEPFTVAASDDVALAAIRGLRERSTWRPIEECGELERGRYLVQLRSGAQIVALWSGDSEGWVLRQRDLDEFDSPRDITHVHRMGPIRGPGEG